jgi:hypothetical protein
MFVGHLAVALGAKTVEPRVPLFVWVAATFFLDLLWPLFLLAGLERVVVDPGNTAFTSLDFVSYPWTHSLLMAVLWSAAAAILCRRTYGTARAGALAGFVVVSHWLLDFVTHRPDLPLWPNGPRTGLGLWESIAGTLLVEGGFFVAALVMYLRAWRARDTSGHLIFGSLVALTLLIWISQPFSPPPPSAMAVAATGLALWLLPFWAHWAERHRIRA